MPGNAEEFDRLVRRNEQLEAEVRDQARLMHRQAADLAAVSAELQAFSYSVSHDLRAPRRAISGFSRIMEQEYGAELAPDATRYLAKVIDNAHQMSELLDAVLLLSRVQRQSLNPGPIDMTELVQECWSRLGQARDQRRIEFALEALPQAEGDRRLVEQVWINLLDNAIKFTAATPAARVEVGARREPGTPVTYQVQDNGAGFDMRYVGKIGQVFQRLHPGEDFPGTGIGLALVQRIVQRHGGRMSAFGEPGAGATVGFTLSGV